MVTIIDPHIKRDDSYSVYRDANAHDGYFVKNKDGNTYDGWCWPGKLAYYFHVCFSASHVFVCTMHCIAALYRL